MPHHKHVMIDFDRRSRVDSESVWCPAGNIEHICALKMASKMATKLLKILENHIFSNDFLK